MTIASFQTTPGPGMAPPLRATMAQATTKTAMPATIASALTIHSGARTRRWRSDAFGAVSSLRIGNTAAAGCGSVRIDTGTALISSHLHLETAGVLLRIPAIPDHAVDELGGAHRILRQRRLGHCRGLGVYVDPVHLLRDGEVIRIFLEQAPSPVLRHEPHAVR